MMALTTVSDGPLKAKARYRYNSIKQKSASGSGDVCIYSLKPEPILETIDDRDDAQLSSSTSDSVLRDTPTSTMCYDVDDPKRGPEWKRARTIDDMDLRQRKRNVGNGSLETKFTFFALLATGLFLFLPHNFFLVDKERKGDDQIRGSNNIVGNMSSGKTLKKAFLRSLIIPNTQAVGADHLAKKHTHPLLESDSVDIACNSFRPPEVHTFVLWNPSLWESQERFLSQSPLIEVLDTFIVTENHPKSKKLSLPGKLNFWLEIRVFW